MQEGLPHAATARTLQNWFLWASVQVDMSFNDMDVCHGPQRTRIQEWDRATLRGVKFTRTSHTAKKSQDNIVMVDAEAGLHNPCGKLFGRVKRFLSVSHHDWDHQVQIVDADWFKPHSVHPKIKCPVVYRRQYENGTMWYVSTINPVNIAMLPYYDERGQMSKTLWQVLAVSPNFMDND